jgi:GH43 family beta-xylosidase
MMPCAEAVYMKLMMIFSNVCSLLVTVVLASLASVGLAQAISHDSIHHSQIRVRDPFIYADANTKTYYLYASIANRDDSIVNGVEVYTSKDLNMWHGPSPVFEVPSDFWAKSMVWAPEMHAYQGKYYLFVTFTADTPLPDPPTPPADNWPRYRKRGTQILVADAPDGPFRAFDNKAHTPENWMALDGTLWVEDGKPYMIFCHEWVQIEDGTIDFVPLKSDLSGPAGNVETLFHASEAPWIVAGGKNKNAYITDGCFLYKTKSGKLLMIWSANGTNGYAIGIADSQSNTLAGPWTQQAEPLFYENGGHGMIFKTFEGQLVLALHQPNKHPDERMQLYKLSDIGHSLRLGEHLLENESGQNLHE